MASAARGAPERPQAHATLLAFIALLEREQHLLTQPQAEALEALATEKQPLLNQIQALADARTMSNDQPLRELLQRAHALNASNARLLTLQRSSCDVRLNLLRGVDPATALYRANGYLGQ